MKKLAWFCTLLVIALACSETPKPSVPETPYTQTPTHTVVNGIERSELALLMRKMYDELKLVRDSLKKGVKVRTDFHEEFKHIQTAHATEPQKIDDTYHGMASSFLNAYRIYEQSQESKVKAYNKMLDGCLACHQQKCPGPIKTINKLKLKPENVRDI